MRYTFLLASVVSVMSLAWVSSVSAQPPPWRPEPQPSYNFERAYRHFLNSPYSYRTFSSLQPGYRAWEPTPFGPESFYQEPGRLHQRITPYGFESYQYVPGYGGTRPLPWGIESYYVPGYPSSYYLPYAPMYPSAPR